MVSRLSGNHYNGNAPKYSTFLRGYGSNWIESWMRVPVVFTLIVLYQGVFSGNAIKIPKRLQRAFDAPFFRVASIMMIALSAVPDIEVALISTALFYGILWLISTPAERRGEKK